MEMMGLTSEWHLMALMKIKAVRGRIDFPRKVVMVSAALIWVSSAGQFALC